VLGSFLVTRCRVTTAKYSLLRYTATQIQG